MPVLPALSVLGGLALFLFAMGLMGDALRDAAAGWLRGALGTATRSPSRGLALGAGLGTLMHSSTATVILVGFIEAGLLPLTAALPVVLGANVGTTFAMQLVSFRLADYWMLPLLAGAAAALAGRAEGIRRIGRAATGFGLLLLGLGTMSGAVAPFRDRLLPWIAHVDGATPGGLLKGLLAGFALTIVVQSSGATIGMCFALLAGGAATRLEQVFPIILGAHVGTCTTALVASAGASPDARRAALFHLLVNGYGSALGAMCSPWLIPLLRATSHDLVRQAANAHTAVMLLAMLPLAPFAPRLVRPLRALLRFRAAEAEPSHLDPALCAFPEQALAAGIRELRRVARLGAHSLRRNAALLLKADARLDADIRRDEAVTDEIQRAMRDFLTALTARRLSRRQALMVQHLERCMTDIERIGDHNENLRELSGRRHRRGIRLPQDALARLVALFQDADAVLRRVIDSLDPERHGFGEPAQAILAARDRYAAQSAEAKSHFMQQTAEHAWTPLQGMLLGDYTIELDRIVRHSRLIALLEQHPFFWIKQEKLGREAPDATRHPDPAEDLDALRGSLPTDTYP